MKQYRPMKSILTSLYVFCIVHMQASTFVVTNTNDTGTGSLRQAIVDANNSAGLDEINFNILGSPIHIIILESDLPSILESIIIDADSQPNNGYTGGSRKVQLNCNNYSGIYASKYEFLRIKGMKIFNASGAGLTIGYNNKATAINVEILNNVISMNKGVGIASYSFGNVIIQGNKIGTDDVGMQVEANGSEGLVLWYGTYKVGGSSLNEGNVISGNGDYGISVIENINSQIIANYIGTDFTGQVALPNNTGIRISRGRSEILNNLISGNSNGGIFVRDSISHVVIKGNKIGTDITGSTVLPNLGSPGIEIFDCDRNVIGGIGLDEGNLISGNKGGGIELYNSSENVIIGNIIGTDKQGKINLGNDIFGIHIKGAGSFASSNNNIIGGELVGEANVIAFNNGNGIYINHSTGQAKHNLISKNSIKNNTYLGIKLSTNGNEGLARPVITEIINDTVKGNSVSNAKIELFYHDGVSTNPQGQTFIATVFADSNGKWEFVGSLLDGTITATATDETNNTSQFSDVDTIGIAKVAKNLTSNGLARLYPVPSLEYVIFEFNDLDVNYQLDLFDLSGKNVKTVYLTEKKTVVDRGVLEKGLYIYNISQGYKVIYSGKLIFN